MLRWPVCSSAADAASVHPSPRPKAVWKVRAGPGLMVLAALFFTVMVALVKIAREDLSPFEVIAWRSVSALPLVAWMARRGGFRLVGRRAFVWRTVSGLVAMTCFYTATLGLPLVDLTLIHKLQPVLVVLLAPVLLGDAERSPGGIWLVCGLGLGGCALLLGPGLSAGNVYGLWALAATVASAFAHTWLRSLGATDRAATVVFWFQLVVSVYAFGVMAGTTGLSLPPVHLWGVLLGVGLVGTGGQVCMTRAYALDRASTVAAASYTSPLFALAGDLIIFGVVPRWNGWLGGVLVVLAGLLLLLRRQPLEAPPLEET